MSRLLTIALSLLVISTVSASVSGFLTRLSNDGEVTAVAPGEGTLDCVPAEDVAIEQDSISPELPSFVCTNGSAVNVKFEVTSTDPIVKTIAPVDPTLPPGHDKQFNVVYDGTGLPLGTRTVRFDVEAIGAGIGASFSFDVEVEVE
jgi:hypothetical protein